MNGSVNENYPLPLQRLYGREIFKNHDNEEVITYPLSGICEESFVILPASVERFSLIIDLGPREESERYCLI
jgi:hypothetical protein